MVDHNKAKKTSVNASIYMNAVETWKTCKFTMWYTQACKDKDKWIIDRRINADQGIIVDFWEAVTVSLDKKFPILSPHSCISHKVE